MTGGEPPEPSRGLAELRQLTVVRCDLVDSTAIQERLGIERYWRLQQAFNEHCRVYANESGAERVRFTGDGFAFAFGRLRAGEGDAARAIRFGLGLVESTKRLKPLRTPLSLRVSIATGEAVVELDAVPADSNEHQPLLSGRVLNLSARLLNEAEPDQVVISELTYQLAGKEFRCRPLGARSLKGFSKPQQCWVVEAPAEYRSRLDAARTEHGQFFGRDHERQELEALVADVDRGQGAVACIVGDPGIGKSRLVRWLVDEGVPGHWCQAQLDCYPHHLGTSAATALEPVSRYLRIACTVSGDESDHEVSAKLSALLSDTVGDRSESAALIRTLVGVRDQERDTSAAPDRLRQRRLAAVRDHFLALAKQQPLALVFEDVHWADSATLSLLTEVADNVDRSQLLLIVVSREPEAHDAPFAGLLRDLEPRAAAIHLTPLDRPASEAMVRDLAATTVVDLDQAVVADIVAHSEGVPLFIENLTHEAAEGGPTTGRVQEQYAPDAADVPKALWDVLMSRLDRLLDAKRFAQIASTVGREFSVDLLSEVMGQSHDATQAAMAQLVDARVVMPAGQRRFQFRHALMRDVAYASLLESDRGMLHDRIAALLSRDFDAAEQSAAALIAQHYELAARFGTRVSENALAAAGYWCEAAKRSADRSEIEECVRRLEHAESVLADVDDVDRRNDVALEIWTERAYVESTYRGWSAHQVGDALSRGFEICEQLGNPPGIFDLFMIAGGYHLTLGQIRKAAQEGQRCLQLASHPRFSSDRNTVIAYRSLAGSSFLLGEHRQALDYIDQGLALCRALDAAGTEAERRMGVDAMVGLLTYQQLVSMSLGNLNDAMTIGQASVDRAEQVNHGNSIAFAKTFFASTHCHRRDPTALAAAQDALDFALENRFATFIGASRMMVGHSLVKTGAMDKGLAELATGAQAHAGIEADTYLPFGMALATSANLSAGNPEVGLGLTGRALELIDKTEEYWYRPEIRRLRARCIADLARQENSDPVAAAVAEFNAATTEAAAQGARFWHLRAATNHAELLLESGRRSEAADLLGPVLETFSDEDEFADLASARSLVQ